MSGFGGQERGTNPRIVADANLRAAIIEHAKAYEINGELLNEYVVVAHWQRVEVDGTSYYTTQSHAPNLPNHIPLGLLNMGIYLILHGKQEE